MSFDQAQVHYSPWPIVSDDATARRLACDPNIRVTDHMNLHYFTSLRDKVTGMISARVTRAELASVTCRACHEALAAQVTRDEVKRNPITR